jgi:hypothetical protein
VGQEIDRAARFTDTAVRRRKSKQKGIALTSLFEDSTGQATTSKAEMTSTSEASSDNDQGDWTQNP